MDGQGATRRGLLAAGLAGGIALTGAARAQGKRAAAPDAPLSVRPDGTYATAPLAKDSWTLGVGQSHVRAVDAANPAKGRRANVQHMCDLIDYASGFSGNKDLLDLILSFLRQLA